MFKICEKCQAEVWVYNDMYFSQEVSCEGLNSEERWITPHSKDCEKQLAINLKKIYKQELYERWEEAKRKRKEEKKQEKERKRNIREGLKKTYQYTWWFRSL